MVKRNLLSWLVLVTLAGLPFPGAVQAFYGPAAVRTETFGSVRGLTTAAWSSTALRFVWDSPADRQHWVGYRIDVATDRSFTHFLPGYQDRAVGNTNFHTVIGLSPASNYYVRVRAFDTSGHVSDSSASVFATTFPSP